MKKPLMFISKQKIYFILALSQRYGELIILVPLGLDLHTQSDTINFGFYQQVKK